MIERLIFSENPVLLVGGGDVDRGLIETLLETVGAVVAADSGADILHDMSIVPDALIGDLDSVSPEVLKALPQDRVHHIAEQDSTDFDKCLRNIDAPLIICVGFLGARVDHQLAVMTVMVRRADQRVMLVGQDDIVAVCPPNLALDLPAGMRLSLFPLGQVSGRSKGLRWPIDGISFAPDGRVGTSNEVTGPVALTMDAPKMLVMVPPVCLPVVRSALLAAPDTWPVPAG